MDVTLEPNPLQGSDLNPNWSGVSTPSHQSLQVLRDQSGVVNGAPEWESKEPPFRKNWTPTRLKEKGWRPKKMALREDSRREFQSLG